MASYRKYHYHIDIQFNKPSCLHGKHYVGYKGSGSYLDTIIFFRQKISFVMSRTRKIDDGELLSTNKAIVDQINKALLCYYATSVDFPQVKSIKIILKHAKDPDILYSEADSFIQPLSVTALTRKYSFPDTIVNILLDDSPKAKAIRIAMSYWLKAIFSDDHYYRFDHLWRAFNRIYMHHGSPATTDFDCLREMRSFLLSNAACFTQSLSITNSFSGDLGSFRWIKMIQNEYDKSPSSANKLAGFVKRYSDYRVMKLLKEKIICRKTQLTYEGLWGDVNRHIDNHISLQTVNDMEIVTLLAIKYAYYIRNKNFHGEVFDGTFKLKRNNVDDEMLKINRVLEVLVFELIMNNGILRP